MSSARCRTRAVSSVGRVALLAAAASSLAGCPDIEGELDDYEARQAEAPPVVVTTDCGEAVDAVEGHFVFALSSDLGKTTPLMFFADITTEDGKLAFTFQPLAAADRKTPVGEPISVSGYEIKDGKFTADLPVLAVPGAGNPISGTDVEADIALEGGVCADALCGKVTGMVIKPFEYPLEKSAFYMERIPEGEDPPALPYINCDKEKADPIPED